QSYTSNTVAGTNRLLDGSPATSVPLRSTWGVAQDAAGNIYFADEFENRIRRVGTDGKISTIAGTGESGFSGDNAPAFKATLDSPRALRLDGKGSLYISDYNNNRVRKLVLATGVISLVAGNGAVRASGDNGPATAAALDPDDIAIDAAGNLYIADYTNNAFAKWTRRPERSARSRGRLPPDTVAIPAPPTSRTWTVPRESRLMLQATCTSAIRTIWWFGKSTKRPASSLPQLVTASWASAIRG